MFIPIFNKILALSELKIFAKDWLDFTQNIKFVFHRQENIVGKGENAGYQFSPFPIMFSKGRFLRLIVW